MALLISLLPGCSSAGGGRASSTVPIPSTAAGAPAARYISLGDSYAAGSRPSGGTGGSTTTDGFPYQVVARAPEWDRSVEVLNFGCSGATSQQILSGSGCDPAALGPAARPYPGQSQARAALAAMRADPASVALVTIVMGANDVHRCLFDVDAQACIDAALPPLARNVGLLVREIRAVVGPEVPIVGLSYFNPYLAASVVGGAQGRQLATMSDQMFRTALNPALEGAYTDNGARFVDITALVDGDGGAGGADTTGTGPVTGSGPGTDTSTGIDSEAADQTCRLTFYCQYKDVHPTPEGHALIADAVLRAAFGR